MSNNKVWEQPASLQLAKILAKVGSISDMQNVLSDLMTEKEIIEISTRLEAARMLQRGEKYTEIIKSTNLSSRTIARISECLKNGMGGYKKIIILEKVHPSHILPDRN